MNNNIMENQTLKNESSVIGQQTSQSKLQSIFFVRAVCSLGIIIFHYFCHSNGNFKILFKTANATWGFMLTTCFFCISGNVLYYNYPKLYSLKKFYYKRWRSIFPSFYICFIYFFLNNVFAYHKIFYNGHWSKLLITIIGLDGYLNYRLKTYFIIGEWFLGAIIIIYALYPLILWLMNKNIFIIYFIVFIFYFIMYKTNYFIIIQDINIISCINSFYFGMISIKFKNIFFETKIILFISFFISIFLNIIKVSDFILVFQIQGYSLFIILMTLGKFIMTKIKTKFFYQISKISYSIYLIHHRVIFAILGLNNPIEWYLHLILILCIIIFTIICSIIHFMVVNSVINSKI